MKIETTDYQIAPLLEQEKIIDIIQQAEARLAELTGSPITLIAYSKTEGEKKL